MVDYAAELQFFSRIDDNTYLEFNDGTRVLILFQNDSEISFDDIIVFDAAKTNMFYLDRLKCSSTYSDYYPIHLFTQP